MINLNLIWIKFVLIVFETWYQKESSFILINQFLDIELNANDKQLLSFPVPTITHTCATPTGSPTPCSDTAFCTKNDIFLSQNSGIDSSQSLNPDSTLPSRCIPPQCSTPASVEVGPVFISLSSRHILMRILILVSSKLTQFRVFAERFLEAFEIETSPSRSAVTRLVARWPIWSVYCHGYDPMDFMLTFYYVFMATSFLRFKNIRNFQS